MAFLIPVAIAAASAAPYVVGGIAAYSAIETVTQTKSAQKEAKKQARAQAQREQEAGEYWQELNRQQMELQAQTSQMNLLANIIGNQPQKQSPVLQLPPAKTYTPIERMNQAIDDWLKGG